MDVTKGNLLLFGKLHAVLILLLRKRLLLLLKFPLHIFCLRTGNQPLLSFILKVYRLALEALNS